MLQSICQLIWKTQQWPRDWKMSVFTPVPKKGNTKQCSIYRTIATMRGRRVYGGGGIIPDIFVPIDTTRATNFYIQCNRKATQMRFAQTMFDKYRGSLAQIDDFGKLDTYLDQIDLAGQFISYAERVDGIKLKPGEWEDSKIYMMPQLKALVGRFSKLDDEAFYRFYIPIDDTIKAAMENPATVD